MGSSQPKAKATASSSSTLEKPRIGKKGKKRMANAEKKKTAEQNLLILEGVADQARQHHENRKQKHEETKTAYNNGANPQFKDQLDQEAQELEKLVAEQNDYGKRLNALRAEIKGYDEMDEDESDDEPANDATDEPMIEPPVTNNDQNQSNPPPPTPEIQIIEPDEPPVDLTEEESDEEASFTPAQLRKITGREDDGEIVAWKSHGNSKKIIIRYGPRNARKYERSTCYKSGLAVNEAATNLFGPDNRIGDEKLGKKYVRKNHEFLAIDGVALEDGVKLEDLKPKEKGEKRKYPQGDFLVKWKIDGKIYKSWEVRTSIKHLWPNPSGCDLMIYHAAIYHAKRHEQWQAGQRKARDRSATPMTGVDHLMPPVVQPTKPIIKTEQAEDEASIDEETDRMLTYRAQWCKLKKLNPEKLDFKTEMQFLTGWNEIKDTL